MFGYNLGKIENVIMENVNIYVDYSNSSKIGHQQFIGAIVGENDEELRNIGIASGNITSINITESTTKGRSQRVGGIIGSSYYSNIYNCYNNANITVTNTITTTSSENFVGGIAGTASGNVEIVNCYNTGDIIGNNACENKVGGITGRLRKGALIENSYNKGKITAKEGISNKAGGIAGENGEDILYVGRIKNSYYTNTSAKYSNYEVETGKTSGIVEETTMKAYSETLGKAFISDGNKIDKYENIVDNVDFNGNIIYINNGYPILKWQVTENK